MKDLISVIVPVYNIKKYLNRCLDSIINQTYKNLEIIIVDDGSTDGCYNICEEYKNKYSNISVIHKKNGGLGFARNSGLDVANGKYVVFVDGDDYINNDHIENLYNNIISNKADTCLSGFTRVYSNYSISITNPCAGENFKNFEILSQILVRMCGKLPNGTDNIEMSVCMAMFSNSIIKKHNIRFVSEREYISEDLIFDLNYYSYAKKVCVTSDVGYCYCDNMDSLTTKYRQDRFVMQKKMTNKVLEISKNLGIYNLAEQRIFTTFLAIARYSIKLEVKFKNQNGRKKMVNNVKMICNDDMLHEVLKNYHNNEVPLKSKLVNILMKYKMICFLIIIMKIKNKFDI